METQFTKGQKVLAWDENKSNAIKGEYLFYNAKNKCSWNHVIIGDDGFVYQYANCEALPDVWIPKHGEYYFSIHYGKIFRMYMSETLADKQVIESGLYWKTMEDAEVFYDGIKSFKSLLDEGKDVVFKTL